MDFMNKFSMEIVGSESKNNQTKHLTFYIKRVITFFFVPYDTIPRAFCNILQNSEQLCRKLYGKNSWQNSVAETNYIFYYNQASIYHFMYIAERWSGVDFTIFFLNSIYKNSLIISMMKNFSCDYYLHAKKQASDKKAPDKKKQRIQKIKDDENARTSH